MFWAAEPTVLWYDLIWVSLSIVTSSHIEANAIRGTYESKAMLWYKIYLSPVTANILSIT